MAGIDLEDENGWMDDSANATTLSRKGVKVGQPRTKGYSPAECQAITKAMLKAKNDPLNGPDQKALQFENNFHTRWRQLVRPEWPHRTLDSLRSKYALADCLHCSPPLLMLLMLLLLLVLLLLVVVLLLMLFAFVVIAANSAG